MTTITHHTELDTFESMPLDENWGSFNTYSDSDKAVVVEWRTGKAVKRFKGETAWSDANRWASDLHFAHDIY